MPIATARGWRSSWAGECAIFTVAPSVDRLPGESRARSPPHARDLARLALPSLRLGLGNRQPDPSEGILEREHVLGVGLVDGERPDLGSPQRDAVAAERIGNRADVGPGADAEIERRDAVSYTR